MRKALAAAALAILAVLANPAGLQAQSMEPVESAKMVIDWSAGDSAPQTSFNVSIPAEAAQVEFAFAVIVTLAAPSDTVDIRVNGNGTGTAPLYNPGNLVFKLEQTFLNVGGDNTISFVDEAGNALAVDSIQMFQLEDVSQDVHFHHFFATRTPTRRVTPPLHSSQNNYDVTHYTIEVEPAMTSRAITGKVTIEAESLVNGLAQVALDFDDASIDGDGATLLTIGSVNMVPPSAGLTYSYDAANKWIIINIPLADRPDIGESFTLQVEYSGTPTLIPSSFSTPPYGRVTQPSNGKPVVYTFGEPYGARAWFPCKDVTSDKAMVDMKITVPDPNVAVSHGTLVGTTALSGSRTEFHWSHGYPICTYLIAFCASEYSYAEGDYTALDNVTTMPVGHYVYQSSPGELAAVPQTIGIIETFAGMFGEYPYLDEKYVTMTWGATFGMEHTTCTSINNGNLNSVTPVGQSRRNIHELAHQWFGDFVSPQNFDHAWLNEGWATYCEALFYESIGTFNDYKNYVQTTWMNVSNNQTTPLVNPNADAFANNLIYRKGGIVLHMLRHVVGDTAFFQGAQDYLAAHAHGTALSDDLKDAFEAASGKDLDPFFDDWVYGVGRPSYQWSWAAGGNELTIFVRQTGTNFFEMPIDIVADLSGGGTQTFVFDNTAQNQVRTFDITGLTVTDVNFDPDRWIYRQTTTEVDAVPAPTLLSVVGNHDGDAAAITWASGGGLTAGFELFGETSPGVFTLIAGSGTLGAGATTFADTGLTGIARSYRIRGVSSVGAPGGFSDTYRVSQIPPSSPGRRSHLPRALIVDGYDRWDTQNRGSGQPWAAVHGQALDTVTIGYDTCANEQVISGAVLLADYDAVAWVLGEESIPDRSFDATEQALVQSYLESGGNLFVSGAEIGWDVGRAASANYSPGFYNNYLKATFVNDDWNGAYTITRAASGSIFNPVTMNFDDGDDGVYFAAWPDIIAPANGASLAYEYAASNGAAIYYAGTFGSGSETGHLFYMGFGFETIYTAADRNELMQSVVAFFDILTPASSIGQEWVIF